MPSDKDRPQSSSSERRQHRRMEIRLPVECRREDGDGACIIRTITQNVSTGGMYIELDSPDFGVGDRLRIELTVPAAEGVSPYQGRAICAAEVLRVQPLSPKDAGDPQRFGIASRFLDKLRISY
ncbi:MAG: PilZ domain-containing protein [Phycisphaerales bacterium]|nr:PilZ domain-containing protein [Phycisphaerales bacterium]